MSAGDNCGRSIFIVSLFNLPVKANGDVRLRGEIIDLVGTDFLDNADEIGAVGKVAIVQLKPHIIFMLVLIKVVNPIRIKQ